MAYEYHIIRRVEFSETDMAGIMHFSNFFQFMETAETAFLRSLGLSVVLTSCGLDLCLPRVHAECDYTSPLRFEDEVLVHLLVKKKSARSLTYEFRFHRLGGPHPREVARGKIVAVCARRDGDGTLRTMPLPKAIVGKIHQAPPHVLAAGGLPSGFRLNNPADKSAVRQAKTASRNRRALTVEKTGDNL